MNANNAVNISADNNDQDFITENTVSDIARYATETTASNSTDDYSMYYNFTLEADGAVLDFATVTRDEARFIADSLADAGTGVTLNVVTGDYITKTITATDELVNAAENSYNNSGLSIFMETLNHALITQ